MDSNKTNTQRENEMAKHVRREHITGNNKLKKMEGASIHSHKTRLQMTSQEKKIATAHNTENLDKCRYGAQKNWKWEEKNEKNCANLFC